MIKNVTPRVVMRDSPLTTSPQTGAVAIMDDTVYTMDDSRVMMGGQVTIYSNIRGRTVAPVVRANAPKRR